MDGERYSLDSWGNAFFTWIKKIKQDPDHAEFCEVLVFIFIFKT